MRKSKLTSEECNFTTQECKFTLKECTITIHAYSFFLHFIKIYSIYKRKKDSLKKRAYQQYYETRFIILILLHRHRNFH